MKAVNLLENLAKQASRLRGLALERTNESKAKGIVDDFAEQFGGAPPTVPGAVIGWLASSPDAEEFHGQTVDAQLQCLKLNLVPQWQPKNPKR